MKKPTLYDWYQQRDHSFNNACKYWVQDEEEVTIWNQLIFWAEAQWEIANFKDKYPFGRKTSKRQQEVQRLWQQRGLLERTKANLSGVQRTDIYTGLHISYKDQLIAASNVLDLLILINQEWMSKIKERIPK